MSVPLVLLASAVELPPGDEWLSPAERAALQRFRVPKRRHDFRLGRLAAKRVLARLYGDEETLAARRFEVRPAPGGVPVAFRDGARLDVRLSISHSAGWAVAAFWKGLGELLLTVAAWEEPRLVERSPRP